MLKIWILLSVIWLNFVYIIRKLGVWVPIWPPRLCWNWGRISQFQQVYQPHTYVCIYGLSICVRCSYSFFRREATLWLKMSLCPSVCLSIVCQLIYWVCVYVVSMCFDCWVSENRSTLPEFHLSSPCQTLYNSVF